MLRKCLVAGLMCALLMTAASLLWAKDSKEEQQAKVRETAQKGLNKLYEVNPQAKAAIQKAAGYAVFSNFGMKIHVAGGGSGKGIAVDNKTRKEVFMKMAEVQAGLGFGAKKFTLVWVFATKDKLNQFINSGWEGGAQATAAAKTKDSGGAMQGAIPMSEGVWLYQLTD